MARALRRGEAEKTTRKHGLRSVQYERPADEEGMIEVKIIARKQRRSMMPSIDA